VAEEHDDQGQDDFRVELESLINRNSMESGSNTPDFVLAYYLRDCLDAFDRAVVRREKWYGISQVPGEDGCGGRWGVARIIISTCDRPGCGKEFNGEPYRNVISIRRWPTGTTQVVWDLCPGCNYELSKKKLAAELDFGDELRPEWEKGEGARFRG
jgi:hypothetical protein